MLMTQAEPFSVARRTLKNNHIYLVDDIDGTIHHQNNSGLGFYHLDTRFLSCYEIHLNNTLPVPLLSSTETGYLSTLVYTNKQFMPAVSLPGTKKRQAAESLQASGEAVSVLAPPSGSSEDPVLPVPEETIQFKRETILNDHLYERFTLTNYNPSAIPVEITFRFDADFRDIFEVRHLFNPVHGSLNPPHYDAKANELVFSYQDATGQTLETRIRFTDWTPEILNSKAMNEEGPVQLAYRQTLEPLAPASFGLEIRTVGGEKQQPLTHPFSNRENPAVASRQTSDDGFADAFENTLAVHQAWDDAVTSFESDNDDFNEMLTRSHKDLRMLTTRHGEDTYIAAGIPWYTCLFGRDSLITARDCLILNPAIAREILKVLAKYQGKEHNPWRDEAPGKILHELRVGELARMGEIPHTPYYGSVDATALWIILLHDYFVWTQDYQTLSSLWPNALAAMEWIDSELANSKHGYLMYLKQSEKGLWHQGWKDSSNSAMDETGKLIDPPIALSEVQGYVYLAKLHMAEMAEVWGEKTLRLRLRKEARDLKNRFNQDFWMPEHEFLALGLDGDGQPMRVVSSNPGHCLETGIVSANRAKAVANRLMAPDMFSGWGIRTLSEECRAYNPLSYHNGSIWPHDNAMIARGFAALGRTDSVDKVFGGLFEAARQTFYKRLPELFCGFPRDFGKTDPPVKYPVACSPQAWAASSVFSLTQSLLNLKPDLQRGSLRISRPKLPHWVNHLRVKNLKVGTSSLDLEFRRANQTVLVDVLERHGKIDLLLEI